MDIPRGERERSPVCDGPTALSGVPPTAGHAPRSAWYALQVFEDLLWADPADDEDSPELAAGDGFAPNVRRSISVQYGHAALTRFLSGNGMDVLLRAHEVQSRGFRVCKSEKVVTVFTSSRYCGDDNLAGVAMVTKGLVRALMRTNADAAPDMLGPVRSYP